MSFRFDVAFSFAGPHRDKVRTIAELVRTELGDGKVFFDEWFEDELGGDRAEIALQEIYGEQSLMVIADVSNKYAGRPWCQAEANAIGALRMSLDSARKASDRLRLAYIRFDNGKVPGVLRNAITWDARKKTEQEIAGLILSRLKKLNGVPNLSLPNNSKKASVAVRQVAPGPIAKGAPRPILFFHPATNDEFYSRRERELAWLDDCAKNPDIRIATVTGVGGLGKTSLVGRWLQVHKGWQQRAFHGVFFYSFYSDRKSESFFATYLKFVCEVENIQSIPADQPLHHLAAFAVQKWSYLVVLDGLEVLQQNEDDPHYGWIDDPDLNEFVARAGAMGSSLLILTSRFPFPQITREHPDHARTMELPLLDAREGADLLARCGLTDSRKNLEAYSVQFGGHPLALRLFAGACQASPWTDPASASRSLLHDHSAETLPDPNEAGIASEEVQRRKQRRQFYKLLTWFQEKLPPDKRRLIQIVALFKEPVVTATVTALARGLDAMRDDFGGCDAAHILYLLDQLKGEHLLQREDDRATQTISWAAHPIVRDVFRETALEEGNNVAAQFAKIVAGKGTGSKPKTVEELQPILEGIEVLLAARDVEAANDLFQTRLDAGWLFVHIPVPQEGLSCARAFLEPQERRQVLEEAFGQGGLAFYLNWAAVYASMLGEMSGVEKSYQSQIEIRHGEQSWCNLSRGFRNLSEAQGLLGRLEESVESAYEALFYAGVDEQSITLKQTRINSFKLGDNPPRPPCDSIVAILGQSEGGFLERPSPQPVIDAPGVIRSRAYCAEAYSLSGQLRAASQDFAKSDTAERAVFPNEILHSTRGIRWSRHRQRLGETGKARELTDANRAICERNDWINDLSRCYALLGELDLADGALEFAFEQIERALCVFREARQGKDLPDTLLAMARVRRAFALAGNRSSAPDAHDISGKVSSEPTSLQGLRAGESALADCEEALRRAQYSGFLLKQCDALNFRSVLRRDADEHELAIQDAKDALEIAERCGYYWGRHEALRQLRDSCRAAGKTADAAEWDRAEQELTRLMAPEIAAALEINRKHDEEMERLYGKGKKG